MLKSIDKPSGESVESVVKNQDKTRNIKLR